MHTTTPFIFQNRQECFLRTATSERTASILDSSSFEESLRDRFISESEVSKKLDPDFYTANNAQKQDHNIPCLLLAEDNPPDSCRHNPQYPARLPRLSYQDPGSATAPCGGTHQLSEHGDKQLGVLLVPRVGEKKLIVTTLSPSS